MNPSNAARMTSKRSDAARRRREHLIRAGILLLSRSGSPPRVEDITSEAGTAKGTFYLHFPSWGAFLSAVRDELLADYQREMMARLKDIGPDTYWSLFEAEVGNFIRWMRSNGNLHRSVFHGAEVNSPVPTELAADQAIARILDLGKELGHVSEQVESALCARLIFGALHSIVDTLETAQEDDVIRESIRFVHSAVASSPSLGN